MSPPSFQPGFNSSIRLPTTYQAAESFAYAQYAHDTYLMASKARQAPYSRNMDYSATYRHSHLKGHQYQNPSPSFSYNFDAR